MYTNDPTVQPELITHLFEKTVDARTNDALCADFSDEETSYALFQIGPTKAPGPDGFPACFFQRNWCTFKEDIVNAVKNFFKDGIMPEGVNDTAIVLTPKIKKSNHFKGF